MRNTDQAVLEAELRATAAHLREGQAGGGRSGEPGAGVTSVRTGVVQDASATDGTILVQIAGVNYDLHYLHPYQPAAGDVVRVLCAGGPGGAEWVVLGACSTNVPDLVQAVKGADQNFGSTTLANITDLAVPVFDGETYECFARILYDGSTARDIKVDWHLDVGGAPAGNFLNSASFLSGGASSSVGQIDRAIANYGTSLGRSGVGSGAVVEGYMYVTFTSDQDTTLRIRAAQLSGGSPATRVKATSSLVRRRVRPRT